MKISKVVIIINPTQGHAKQTGAALKAVLDHERVQQQWLETLPLQKNLYRRLADMRKWKADLVIACGGDGTLLQAAHRFRGSGIPILGISIGYLGFITSIPGNRLRQEMRRILDRARRDYCLGRPYPALANDQYGPGRRKGIYSGSGKPRIIWLSRVRRRTGKPVASFRKDICHGVNHRGP